MKNLTQWTIITDLIAEPNARPGTNSNAVGVLGPYGANLSTEEILQHSNALDFRMKDDDGEIYYYGVMTCENKGDMDFFAPLDQFGMPNAGCTSIEVLENGKWIAV